MFSYMSRLWPGRRTESVDDYVGVLIPLEEAHLHSHSARTGRCEYEEVPDEASSDAGDGDDDGPKAPRDDDAGMLLMSAAEYSIEGLRREVRKGAKGRTWTDYELKSKLINKAIQDIGMGRYHWQLFVLCGFGWFADNLWLQGVSLTLPSLSAEFGVSEKTVRYTTSSLFVGLCLGSFFWGIGSDIMGRRAAFNLTLLIAAVFGIASSYAPSWGWVCVLYGAVGSGVGGNLPVDGSLFLEFLPDASSSLLTLLSIWWPVGQLASSLFAWFFVARWPADQGWRLFVLAIGAVTLAMFAVRFAAFRLLESPKYLLSRGRQAEAVAVVHGIAFRNGAKTWLTADLLDAVVDGNDGHGLATAATRPATASARPPAAHRLSTAGVVRGQLAALLSLGDRLRPLFATRKLGLATAIVWFCWATIGMGYPLFNAFLPQYLSHSGGGSDSSATTTTTPRDDPAIPPQTYRNYAITSLAGVPGSLLAAYTVDLDSPLLGRRGTLALSTLTSAVFLFLFAQYGAAGGGAQLLFSCVEAFAQNIMYGVLYAFTPEIFPAPVRGAGTGVASFLNRVMGLAAPIIAATFPGDGATGPIYLSGALILAAFVGVCLIPIETRGRQRL